MPLFVSPLAMKIFRDQFLNESGKLVYRKDGEGPAYAIGAAQEERFVATFMTQQRRLMIGAAVSGGLLCAVLTSEATFSAQALWLWALLGVVLATTLYLNHRSYVAPARLLAKTSPISQAFSQEQRQTIAAKALSKVDYPHLAAMPVLGLFWVWRVSKQFDPLHGWGLLAWLFPAALTALSCHQAYRKFRYQRGSSGR